MKILVLDNYDSFTYNLVHALREAGARDITVARNDKIPVDRAEAFDKILLSPGPGVPSESGILCELIRRYAPRKSILGVCLGQQAIGEVFGARLLNLSDVYHGVGTEVEVTAPDPLFDGLGGKFIAGRYHSWIVDREGFPDQALEVTAVDAQGAVMALRHRTYDVRGVQFHPESVLTPLGGKILENWLRS
ncbi:MAG: aminodeoxychorismate/anthranilate synthase component II [Rikenellaceae bacterium]|nr:aminodeoxychorismate/anthranilate synthase component II [Rikenellaceae bacterium]